MTQTLLNNAETGLSTGTTATQGSGGNTGYTGGNFIDTFTKGTATQVAFSSVEAAHGSLSYLFTTGGTSATVIGHWIASITDTPTKAYARLYVYMSALPSVAMIISQMADASGGLIGTVEIMTTGAVKMLDATSTQTTLSTTTLAANAWNRLEFFMVSGASTGQTELNIFTSPDSATPTETNTSGATHSMNGNAHGRFLFGLDANSTSYSMYFDSIGWTDVGYLGADVAATPEWGEGVITWGT